MHDLKVWPDVAADGDRDTTTPGKTSGREDEMSRLAKVSCLSLRSFLAVFLSSEVSESLRGLIGRVLDHRSLPPEFESWRGHI